MDVKATPDVPARAIEQAAEWSVLLLDEPDDRELRRRFEAWLAESTENRTAWARMERTAGLASDVLPDYAPERRPFLERRSRPARYRRWLAPVVVGLALLGAWTALPTVALRLEADELTGTAEVRSVRLQDGSTVTLAPESAIELEFTPQERRVRLLKGEAFFDVASQRDRPFKVAARSVEASVVGTRFNVHRKDSAVAISVEEGRVLVEAAQQRELLEAMQGVEVSEDGRFRREQLDAGSVAAWRRGMAYLRDRPLADAVERIRPYFDGKILVMSSSLQTQPTTGVLDLREPEAALRGLMQAHGATVRRISPWLLVVSEP